MAPRRGRPWYLSPTAYVRRAGVTKGVFGGSTGWLAAGVALWFGGKVKSTLGKSEEFAASERLKPGEFVTIRAIPVPTRREKKADARRSTAARKAAELAAEAAKRDAKAARKAARSSR